MHYIEIMSNHKLCFLLVIFICVVRSNTQSGPDPWHYDSKYPDAADDHSIPPDLRMPIRQKVQPENKFGIGEWFFKRTLAIVLKGGNTKKYEDGMVEISLQMKFNPKQWETLEEAIKSDSSLSEDMLRRSVGYIEESIHKPSIAKQIILTWSEYIQVYLTEYRDYITWSLCFLAAAGTALWTWSHMSHKNAIIILLIIFYAYEVVISYKEAEQKELEKFLSAVNKCKWYFWTSSCEVPRPDPLVFMKHMNPLKIGIRMFTAALAEPIVVISGTVETILHSVTDGLWYPLDKIVYGILIVAINMILIVLLVMILFNYLLNTSFNLNLFGIGVSVKDKQTIQPPRQSVQAEGISSATLDKILDVCSLALSNNIPVEQNKRSALTSNVPKIRRSASTGRLPNLSFERDYLALENNVRQRNINPRDGSGDAQ